MNEIKSKYEFISLDEGTCKLVIKSDFSEEEFVTPEFSPKCEKVVLIDVKFQEVKIKRLYLSNHFRDSSSLWQIQELEEIHVPSENPFFSSIAGVLFNKDITALILCPSGKTGKFIVPSTVKKIKDGALAYYNCHLHEIIFQEGLVEIDEQCSLYGPEIVTLPASVKFIHKEAFDIEYGFAPPIIRAPQHSFAHDFAVEHGYKYMSSDCNVTWDSESWLKKFNADNVNYRELRKEVWENTKTIVETNGYTLFDETSVVLLQHLDSRKKSSFYHRSFTASFEPLRTSTKITVVSDDCLDVAHKWVNEGLEVCILNMASRRNPGGGVTKGAGAQEEYLFRCSDYYKFLYRYAPYAKQYGLTRSHYQYPLDRNFGGIYSPQVTIFRENEESGYKLANSTWQVNIIAVAGMNSPQLILENGKERIVPELVEGVKNKIRTIFRIACDNGQRNLILGALGCGAFHNPPEHVAEIFRDVLCEQEFEGAFERVCFAVKTDHNSHGNSNYFAFKRILHDFIPSVKEKNNTNTHLSIKKIAISRDDYALLKENGEVIITNIYTCKSRISSILRGCIDIAGGFHHFIGLRKYGEVVFEATGSQAPKFRDTFYWSGGISVVACEGHSAMLKNDGSVLCDDDNHWLVPQYAGQVEELRDVKQIVLTFEQFYYLVKSGKFMSGNNYENDFFNDGREIIQITAFGCYYSMVTLAVLYADGTVKASYDGCPIEEVKEWSSVRKICCGNHGFVFGLTKHGKVLLPQDYPYKDREGKPVTEITDIVVDIEANFEHFIALTANGKIIYLREVH